MSRVPLALCLFGLALAAGAGCASSPEPAPGALVPQRGGYPTLVNPACSHCVDEAKKRAGELRDDDRVLAWIRGKYQGGAIPLRFFLVPYRVISDSYGVFVYDPEAGFARGFEPSYDFTFYGWRNGVIVIRHKDGTLYSGLTGLAFDGPRKGHRLKAIPTMATDWGAWKTAYPGSVAYNMFPKYKPVEAPAHDDPDSLRSRGGADPRLPPSTEVFGLVAGDSAKAYSIETLERAGGIVTDRVGTEEVAVLWNAPTRTAAAYSTTVEDTSPPLKVTLAWDRRDPKAPLVDRETGSRWGIEGRAVEGPLKGKTIRWMEGLQCRWFAWAAEYPGTLLYSASSGKSKAGGVSPNSPAKPLEAVLVEPDRITPANVALWKSQGMGALVAVLDERYDPETYRSAAGAVEGVLDLYYWMEVGRNRAMAEAHPEWMASLGSHQDWQKRFPNVPLPRKGEVAKAFPWVPIGYRDAFEAHVARASELLKRAAGDFRGLLLNDIQGGPASCGCGNLQCRWALDYGVPSTAAKAPGPDVALRFVQRVRELAPGKEVIPIWTIECEDEDLPDGRRPSASGTGYCASVECSRTTCPREFARQWSGLLRHRSGPLGVLALSKEFGRERPECGSSGGWIRKAIEYLDTVPASAAGPLPRERLWLVIQGYDVEPEEFQRIRAEAAETRPAVIVVARARVEQSYEPKILPAGSAEK